MNKLQIFVFKAKDVYKFYLAQNVIRKRDTNLLDNREKMWE